jgi:hypothetical protein
MVCNTVGAAVVCVTVGAASLSVWSPSGLVCVTVGAAVVGVTNGPVTTWSMIQWV